MLIDLRFSDTHMFAGGEKEFSSGDETDLDLDGEPVCDLFHARRL